MTTAKIPPTGVYVPAPTFFKSSFESSSVLQREIDVETQINHSVYLAKCGIRGLVLLGSTGEAIHMSRKERFELVSGVRKGLDEAGFHKYPIMAGVLVNNLEEAIEWCKDFKEAGVQWALVLVPGYFGEQASQAGIQEWFTKVADNSPIPILMLVAYIERIRAMHGAKADQ
jgi:2-keto-3-deoxy-L-rhamnonate aldolase